jgi:tetratricopeptide (TPR) repeat protein
VRRPSFIPSRSPGTSLALVLASALCTAALAPLAPLASPLGAQEKSQPVFLSLDGKEPKRPRLEAGADTNDARAYIDWGHQSESWKKSFDAYYWAWRLDPQSPMHLMQMYNAVYGAQSPEWRNAYNEGATFALKSRESRLLDSLENTVYYREPFAHFTYRECRISRDWLEALEDDPYLTGVYYQGRGCYTQAADAYGKTLAKKPDALGARMNLVRMLYFIGHHGNAMAHIDTAITQLRARDNKRTYRLYSSKEQLETMRGEIYESLEDYNNAKKAYGKALEENLSYWPAHVRLARLASLQQEHDEALQEYDQAVQLAEKEPTVHFDYGIALLRARKPVDAEREFRRALELEPYFALARFNLGVALDNQGKKDEAIETYRTYIASAPRRQGRMINHANERLQLLGAAQTTSK